ncbi:T9SS-dependent choice-of-anchor J family protein [Flavobacterium sp. Sd200]|uniref:T9SS-dependent choice-of-anchor J family protein n=1 Tax=Flavobacterium sp. Sd200 TaxID=2692211 RepID=UPI001F17BBA1|nr:T9SS type A sorting domain-containing protein [Flavobacterium sp. Sd200]
MNRLFILLAFLGLNLNMLQAQTTILDETLLTEDSFGTFTPVSVTGTQNWYFREIYGAVCSGYAGGQSFENEDWLISPIMNLAEMDDVVLTFSHTRGSAAVMNVGVEEGWYKAFATADYTGDPLTTQWIELDGLNQNITTAWQYINSGNLVVPEGARSENSRIAFRYMSSASASATWEIKNVRVVGEPHNTNPGQSGTFKITNWNTEWLGCTQFGPTDETLQVNNVVAALRSMNSDIYCIQEVSNTLDTPTVETLVTLLGSEEWGGTIVPSNTGDCNQRQALIYKRAKVQFVSASQLSSGSASQGNSYYYNWSSGRYPALYNVNLLVGGSTIPVSLVNIHAKAEDNNAESYTRRLGGSEALKTILDGTNYNTRNLILIGDFNDYLIGTSSEACNCTVSPYDNFDSDTANYTGITRNIIDADRRFGERPIIENIIISDELTDNYIANSAAQETTMPSVISRYYNTTSNHLPVSARFQFTIMGREDNSVKSSYNIYPNPVTDVLTVNGKNLASDAVVQIYDLTGRQILNQQLNNSTVNVSALPGGVYILKIDNTTTKFIKK